VEYPYPRRAARGTSKYHHGSKNHTVYHVTKAPHHKQESYTTKKPVKLYRNDTTQGYGGTAEHAAEYKEEGETYETPLNLDYFDQEDILYLYNL